MTRKGECDRLKRRGWTNGLTTISSPKIKKYLAEIKNENWTPEELRELLQAIAGDFQINIRIADNTDEDDFWLLSPEEEQRFNDLLDKSTEDLKSLSG